MKKPELLVTPTAVSEIESLLKAGATAIMVGEQRYGLRLAGEFKREDIVEAVNIAHQHDAKVYVAMNGLFHNDKIAELNEYILFLVSLFDIDEGENTDINIYICKAMLQKSIVICISVRSWCYPSITILSFLIDLTNFRRCNL